MKSIHELQQIQTELEKLMELECELWNQHIFPLQSLQQQILSSLDIRERLAMSPQFRTRSFQFDSSGKKYVSSNSQLPTSLRDPLEIQNPLRDYEDPFKPPKLSKLSKPSFQLIQSAIDDIEL